MIRKSFRREVERLRADALRCVREERFDDALAIYDRALEIAGDDWSREMVIIGRADVLLAMGREGQEIHELAGIVFRRRSAQHEFLAAYALLFRWRLANDIKRAIFYGRTALRAAGRLRNPVYIVGSLNELGNVYELNSQFAEARKSFEKALARVNAIADDEIRRLAMVAVVENLGYSLIQLGEVEKGVGMIETVLGDVPRSALSDAQLDLATGYLRLHRYDDARRVANDALTTATTPREKRNARYVLGEIACRSGDTTAAELYFDAIGAEYPEFRNLKGLLMALDLLPLLNLRLS